MEWDGRNWVGRGGGVGSCEVRRSRVKRSMGAVGRREEWGEEQQGGPGWGEPGAQKGRVRGQQGRGGTGFSGSATAA